MTSYTENTQQSLAHISSPIAYPFPFSTRFYRTFFLFLLPLPQAQLYIYSHIPDSQFPSFILQINNISQFLKMEYRPLIITLISAEGLKDVNRFSKMDVYVEVSIAGYPQSMKKTFVDKNSGTNPKWNQRLEFIVDEPYLTKPGLSLLFLLKSESTFGTDKEIGSVTVPVDELFKPDSTEERIVDYKVITASGKPKGSLKFSYRFGEKFTHQAMEAKRHADEPVTAYPAQPYASGSGLAHQGMGYPPPPPPAGYGYGAYPQTSGAYGYQPPPPGYGYPPAGYAPPYGQPQKPKKNKMGMGGGLGMGLGAGLLGGLLVGEMASDIGDGAAYADGYGDAMGDMGGFDF